MDSADGRGWRPGVLHVYATIRYLMNDHYWAADEHYLTPLYSPCVSEARVPGSSQFGSPLPEMPGVVPIAIITFVVLGGFRATCYYYRKAGYRSLFLAPAACAVPEPYERYSGETRFPLVLHNFLYAAAADRGGGRSESRHLPRRPTLTKSRRVSS